MKLLQGSCANVQNNEILQNCTVVAQGTAFLIYLLTFKKFLRSIT